MVDPVRKMVPPGRKKDSKGKNKGAVDPEELSRLLTNHLEKQVLKAEKQRIAKAAKEKPPPPPHKAPCPGYVSPKPFIPQVAATAFERTTTPDPLRQVHVLSYPALKTHYEPLQIDVKIPQSPLQINQAFDQVVYGRNESRDRNQWNHSPEMELAAEIDRERDVNRLPRRSFGQYGRKSKSRDRERVTLRGSNRENGPPVSLKTRPKTAVCVPDFERRNDWAQEDKENGKSWVLRKDSMSWIVRRKTKEKREREESGESEDGSPPAERRNGRGRSFLAILHRR